MFEDLDDDLQIAGIVEEFKNRHLLLRNHNSGNFFSDAVHTIKSCYEEESKFPCEEHQTTDSPVSLQ